MITIGRCPNLNGDTQAEGAVCCLCCLEPDDHDLYYNQGHGDDDDNDHDGDDDFFYDGDFDDDDSLAIQHLGFHLLWYLDPIGPAIPENHHQSVQV